MSRAETTMYAYGETHDGTSWDGLRVTLASKIQLERTCRTQKWDTDRDQFTTSAFLSWHAAKLAKIHDLGWEAFLSEAIDAGLTAEAPDTDELAGDEIGEDPTRPGAGIGSP